MTELEWLKQESGLSDDELKAMEAVAGQTKFVAMLQKIIGQNEQAQAAAKKAEDDRLAFEKRYNDEFIPEMRRVTQDSLKAQAEAAAAQAKLAKAREYGIVPEDEPAKVTDPAPRAPGSPDPNAISRDDFARFSQAQSNTIMQLKDLDAEHFELFGKPLGNTQQLVDEVNRQRTLGHKDFSLRQAWESAYKVADKRTEISKAARQKEIDDAVAADRKARIQAGGDNPHIRSGVPSRFSTYKPSDAAQGKEPWKAPGTVRSRTRLNEWRDHAVNRLRETAA